MKIAQLTIFFIASFSISLIQAQNCECIQLLEQARQYKLNRNYTWAIQLYEEALQQCKEPYAVNYWALVNLNVENGNFSGALQHCKKLVELGVSFKSIENTLWVNDAFIASNEWKQFKSEYPLLRKQFFMGKDVDVLLELEALKATDRASMRFYSGRTGDSLLSLEHDGTLNENMDMLRNIVHKMGWPTVPKVGVEYANTAYQILLKGVVNGTRDTIDWKYYESILKSEMKKGTTSPYNYAFLVDKYYYFSYGYQIFGSWNQVDSFNPIKDLDEVDERRISICLTSLKEFAALRKFELPEGYQ